MKKDVAIKHFGGASRLAEALKVKPASVSQWGEEIPELRAYQIERITGGKLSVKNPPEEYKKVS